MANNFPTTFSINPKLMDNILKEYHTEILTKKGKENLSKAIQYLIADYFLLPQNMQKLPDTIIGSFNINGFERNRSINIRLPKVVSKKSKQLAVEKLSVKPSSSWLSQFCKHQRHPQQKHL